MPNLPTINIIYASDALEQLEALKNILIKFERERRIAGYALIEDADQFFSIRRQVKGNDAVITLLTHKLERLDDIRNISKRLKQSRPDLKVFEIIVDNLPFDNAFAAFPDDLAPIRVRTDLVSVWTNIEITLRSMLQASSESTAVNWKTILKVALPSLAVIALAMWWIFKDKEHTPTPNAAFSSNKTNCEAPCAITFSNTSQNADQYRWDFDNGDLSEEANPTYTFKDNGHFKITLTAFGNGKKHAVTHEIVVNSATTAATSTKFKASKTNCEIPCTIQFTNESQNATSFRWDFGDGTTSTETDPAHKYTEGGTYQVKLVATNTNDKNGTSQTITVDGAKNIPPFEISTTGVDARTLKGDNEIDSDDWTGIKLSYAISVVNSGREVRLVLVWDAQEMNGDKKPGDTRFRSEKTFTLFNVDSCCPGLVIEELHGVDPSADRKKNYQGKVHGFRSFPATGSLHDIELRFDAGGSQDQRQQALKATLSGFSVKLKAH